VRLSGAFTTGNRYVAGFKQFMLPGNVLDLAVVVVIGVAFGAVVTALVKDLIPPLIAAVIGRPDFSAIEFTDHQGCPECLSAVPIAARRCAFCTSSFTEALKR
jgi:large-conductance mechanosensitive channel